MMAVQWLLALGDAIKTIVFSEQNKPEQIAMVMANKQVINDVST